ncbi:uridine kinase [Massilia sp. W12]|uniref:uridine kinase n=1 Tax=Massilia sp. W12 TaxID=3126507 RepID=UPI0030CEB9D3
MNKPFIIGIAGGSGSGKTTVTQQVLSTIGENLVTVLIQDNYYCDEPHLPFEQRLKTNYDHPDAFDWPLLIAHLEALQRGESVAMPTYDFTRYQRAEQSVMLNAAPVIVLEGLFPLYDARLRDMMSLKIFVDTDADVRFIRRLRRDIAERGRTTESVITQYLATVRPMYNQFIEPTRRYADVILPHGANVAAVDMIVTKVASLIDDECPT